MPMCIILSAAKLRLARELAYATWLGPYTKVDKRRSGVNYVIRITSHVRSSRELPSHP
jgi:hypothetical protein